MTVWPRVSGRPAAFEPSPRDFLSRSPGEREKDWRLELGPIDSMDSDVFFLKQKLVDLYPIGSMYGIYANIGGILMVNVTIYSIHGSYGYGSPHSNNFLEKWDFRTWDLQHLVPSFDHAYHTLLVGCLMVFFSFPLLQMGVPEMGDPQVTMSNDSSAC